MNIKMPKNMNMIKSATALSLVMFLTACGGGGGGDTDASSLQGSSVNPPVTAPPASNSGRTITGLASKSPIAGAEVSLYAIDLFGDPVGNPIASGQTDDNGEFSLSVQSEIDLLLKTSGGVFIDESDQEPDIESKRKISLATGEGFMSFIPADGTTAAITPFTDLLVRRAQDQSANSERGNFMENFTVIKSLVDAELGFDVLNTIPANPISPATGATPAQMQYALFLGAFANAVNNISLKLGEATPTFEIIKAVAEDLSDGDLDGQYFGDLILVYLDGDSGEHLPTDVDFNQELARFRNNNFTNFSATPLPAPTGGSISNEPPTANAGEDQVVVNGASVTLSGTESVDPEGRALTYSWTQISDNAQVSVSGANTSTLSFVAESGLMSGIELEFRLTVTDDVGFTAFDDVLVTINPTFAASLFIISENGPVIEDGIPVDGGAKLDFNENGTGQLYGSQGAAAFDWSQTSTGSILIDFSGIGGYVEDQYNESGTDFGVDIGFDFGGIIGDALQQVPDQIDIDVTEITNTIELTVLEGGEASSVPVRITVTGERRRLDQINLTTTVEPISETEELTAYNASVHLPFAVPITVRALPTAAYTGTPTLFDEELYDDILSFQTDGTGFAEFKAQSFTWTIESDGHLKIIFSDGEIAEYFRYNTLSDGDVIGVLYTNLHGDVSSDAFLSVDQQSVELTNLNSAGIYTVQNTFDLDDGTIVEQNRILRLYPNGTAQIERVAIDPETGTRIPVFLPFGICWEAVENEVTITTAFDGNGIHTQANDCGTPLGSFTPFNRTVYSVLQVEGNRYRSHARQETAICDFESESSCLDTETNDIFLIIADKVALTSTPAYAIEDSATVVDLSSSIAIDVLDNDVAGDAAIDAASVVIDTQPRFGTVSVNSSTGVITYTPGEFFIGEDVFFYRVSSISGSDSQSSYAPVTISFDPVANAGPDISARSGSLVILDGSASSAINNAINYSWSQIGGPNVDLDNPNIEDPSFEALGLPVSSTVYEFELQVEDENGEFAYDTVIVTLPPIIPMTFFVAEDFEIPVQFGVDVDSYGSIVTLNSDGSGTINHSSGSFGLTWTEDPGSLNLQFDGSGISNGSYTVFEDVDGSTGDEEVMVDEFELAYLLFFDMDEDGRDSTEFLVETTQVRFDLTNSNPLPNLNETEDFPASVYDPAAQIPYTAPGGRTLTLPTDVSPAIETVDNAPELQSDELSFVSDGTGFARHKNESFSWSLGVDGHLEVVFVGGDIASYFKVESKVSGDFVAVLYQYNSGDVRAFSDLSFEKTEPSGFQAGSIAGIYSSVGRMVLDDGTVVPQYANYIINADNTGIYEGEDIDPVTGQVIGWINSSFGICATVGGNEGMVWYRTRALDVRYPGSRQPDVSHCSALTMADVSFVRTHTLFEDRPSGDIAVLVVNGENDCGIPPTPMTGCDENIINTSGIFPTIFGYTSYDGQAPITVVDEGTIENGVAKVFDVVGNDIVGGSAINLGSVEIVVQPKDGFATVDSISGDITVTVDTIETSVSLYYRVTDMSGNVSTISALNLAVGPQL